MDIAAVSMSMKQAQVQQQVSTAVTAKVMDVTEMQMEGVIDMLQQVNPVPHVPSSSAVGQMIDVKA